MLLGVVKQPPPPLLLIAWPGGFGSDFTSRIKKGLSSIINLLLFWHILTFATGLF